MIISPVHNNIPETFPFQILKWWCSACHLRLICGWLSSLFQISFIASRGKIWAGMINTIKAVHLSTVADGAAFHGAKRSLFTAAADEMQLGINSVWAHKDVHFFLIFILLSARKSQNMQLFVLIVTNSCIFPHANQHVWLLFTHAVEVPVLPMYCSKNLIDFSVC